MSIKPADLIFYSGKTVRARLIEFAQVNPFSHVVMFIGCNCVIEVLPWQPIHVVSADKYLDSPDSYVFECTVLTERDRYRIVNIAKSYIGTPYNIRQLFEQAARLFFHLPIKRGYSSKSFDCSTFVHHCYLQAGIRLTWAPVPSVADLAYSPLLAGKRPWGDE